MRIWLLLICLMATALCALAETYVVCAGISNYRAPGVPDLIKPEQDAKSMAEFYRKGTPHVITVTGRYATKAQLLKCLRSQFGRAKRGDRIVFYFSGHGYPGGFCPYDMTRPEEGLTYEEVLAIMKQSKAADKFIFADACNSGAIRGRQTDFRVPDAGNVMMFLSSRDNENSIERLFMPNGIFTSHLLRALGGGADTDGDRRVTASELFRYVSDNVRRQTDDRQHPVMWGKFSDDLIIVSYPKR